MRCMSYGIGYVYRYRYRYISEKYTSVAIPASSRCPGSGSLPSSPATSVEIEEIEVMEEDEDEEGVDISEGFSVDAISWVWEESNCCDFVVVCVSKSWSCLGDEVAKEVATFFSLEGGLM